MTDFRDTLNAGRKSVLVTLLIAAVAIGLTAYLFCGSAQAAGPAIEARVGDREGAVFGVGFDSVIDGKVGVGALLEFSEDGSSALLGRLVWVKPAGCTVWYMGMDAGVMIEEQEVVTASIPPDGRHGRTYNVTTVAGDDAGLTVGLVAGLRGRFRKGIGWFCEGVVRDTAANDGAGVVAGVRFRN